jgi:hypothetical protein
METNAIENIESENGLEIEVGREFTTETFKIVRQQLLSSLERSGPETLLLKDVATIDIAAIQLAYAWKKKLSKDGRRVTIVLPEDENIKDLLVKTGITQILTEHVKENISNR